VETLRRVVRILAAKRQQIVERYAEPLLGITTHVLLDQIRGETVETRSHSRVGREEIADSSRGLCHFEGLPSFFHEVAGTFPHREGRMPFLQVTDFRLEAECAEQPSSANSEQHFLLQAQ